MPLLQLLSKNWIIPLIVVFLSIGSWQHYTIKNLRQKNYELDQKVWGYQLKAINNEDKARQFDEYKAQQAERKYQDKKFIEVIKNAPQAENGAISLVLRSALNQLQN